MLDAVQRIVPELDSPEVLSAIDRGGDSAGQRFWTLDPVDGTQGFIRGGQYIVALALIVRGRVEIGMLGCPRLSLSNRRHDEGGSIVCAVRDRGAFAAPLAEGEFTRLQVSSCSEPRRARVLRSFEREHINLDTFNRVMRTLGKFRRS